LQQAPDWQEILQYFRGSELQNYFTRVLEDDLKAVIKPQYVVSGGGWRTVGCCSCGLPPVGQGSRVHHH
jgi:hypothetical protein